MQRIMTTTPILVIDLEATCEEGPHFSTEQMEIIEIGAVWANFDGTVIDSFQTFVRPVHGPELSTFCRTLTGIQQRDVDPAPGFAEAAQRLAAFAERYRSNSPVWGSWGKYDLNQITRDCLRHEVDNPLAGFSHRNLKREFARTRKIKEVGMAKALEIARLQLQGAHHRALDDAVNIASLLPHCAAN
jgi:inhibitor of KinA sporulation pathway (predicted exonuclease)